ncbi:MAG: nucleotide sugar dehydrogenase [Helicobacter sp.]|nr:nucleotide sugar dehydrogenase [Helicobacter sp.]
MLDLKIGIIGLGYVGAPLFSALARHFNVVGFDIERAKLREKNTSDDPNILKDCNIFIVTVPTDIKDGGSIDLSALESASLIISNFLKKDDIVIYESTTYPGCTNGFCAPILQKSGLKVGQFHLAYSPERISPGDRDKTLSNITKVISASSSYALEIVQNMYKRIIKNIFVAKSIEVAEASKLIENVQRDLNIAFVNEISMIFNRLDISTSDVLEAARTKWNFLDFTPGLVGGHCIAVDPYYLLHVANMCNFNPRVVSSGRFVNEQMPSFITSNFIKLLLQNGINPLNAKICILGATFKENCDDVRNAKVFGILEELKEHKIDVKIFDPIARSDLIFAQYGVELTDFAILNEYKFDGVIVAIYHDVFLDLDFENFVRKDGIIYDIKNKIKRKGDFKFYSL